MRLFIDKWFKVFRPKYYDSKFVNLPDCINVEYPTPHLLADLTCSDNIKEDYVNSKVDRLKTMGRVRKFRKYRNRFINGKLVCEERTVDLRRQKLSRIIKRESGKPYNYYNALPLPINNISRLIGCVKHVKPQLRYKPKYYEDYFIKEILRKNNESFNEFCLNNNARVLPGAWKFSHINMIDMCTPLSNAFTIEQMLAGLRSRKDLELKLPRVDVYNRLSVLGLEVNPRANPGVNTSRVFGNTRKKSVGYTKRIAYDLVTAMMNGIQVVDKSLIHIGGREKRNIYQHTGIKNAKARVTCGQEDVPTLIGQSLVTPINKSLQMLNEGFNWGGRINGRRNFKKLVDLLDITEYPGFVNVNTDFNQHDASVDENKIVVAFALLRCCYKECEFIDNLFMYALSGMVFKRVVLPESGLVYEITKGVLTGHAFTSIITTICAYITLSTSINNTCDKDVISKTYLQGAGDDWIMRLPNDRLNFIHHQIGLSGNKCDDLTTNSGNLKDIYPNDFPTFLKKHYYLGMLAWNVNELFTNFVYPTSTKLKLWNKIHDYMVMCVSGPFNAEINYCCKKLIIYHIIDWYSRGRSGYYKKDHYQYVFDRVFRALLYERDINICVNYIPRTMSFTYYKLLSGQTDEIPLRMIVKDFLRKFNTRVHKSKVWMLRPTIYERHESVRRLKVFDLNKKYIPANFDFAYTSFSTLLYYDT